MIIYKITNTVNEKVYIGQTVGSIAKRWSQHTTSTKNRPLYSAFRRYGRDKFKIEQICSALAPEYLNELEQYFINYYDSLAPLGYNLTTGGDNAYTRSEHTRRRQSETMTGRTMSLETKQKISNSLRGRPGVRRGAIHTDEARFKISVSQIGKKTSEDTKKKMSDAHKKRLAEDSTRTPAQIEALRQTHEKNKGRIPWNKGQKATEEAKLNQSKAHLERHRKLKETI